MSKQHLSTSYIVMAAGKGTRMCSDLPKVLHRVCGQTLLRRTLEAIQILAPKEIIVVIGAGRELVEKELASISADPRFDATAIRTVLQEKQLGTGHAVQLAFAECSESVDFVAILPGDIPLIEAESLRPLLEQDESIDLSILSCDHPEPYGFGRIVRDLSGKVEKIVEEKDATESERLRSEINSSIYFVRRSVLAETLPELSNANAQKEYYLTDIVSIAVAKGKEVTACCAPDYVRLSGANTIVELSALERIRRAEIVERFQCLGVSFEDPHTAYIDEGVQIGHDTTIGANTRLLGATVIGTHCVLEGDTRIENSVIAERCHLKLGCYVTDAKLASGCAVGPFVQIRPESVLKENVKLGNFVEVKKATLGEGAKANHLAYIGDATVGASSNIGAGTIFCNYDGEKKHHSTLEDNVFIGSNSVLVSPVTIGANAYVGAGSTITKNIQSGALAIGRARQVTIDGWVEKKRSSKKSK